MRKQYIMISVVHLVILLGQGCIKEPPYRKQPVSDVAKTNEVRRSLGIREVKEDWEFYGHRFGEDTWKYGGFECKKVKLNEEGDRILWEQDYYYTGVTWTDIDGTNREFLATTYDYTEGLFFVHYNGERSRLNGLQNRLESTAFGYKAETNEETLKITDEILTTLGKSRLE